MLNLSGVQPPSITMFSKKKKCMHDKSAVPSRKTTHRMIIPDSLKQNTSNFCVTGARHGTKPVWFRPQLERALLRGMTAKCSSIHPYLKKTNHEIISSTISSTIYSADWGDIRYYFLVLPACFETLFKSVCHLRFGSDVHSEGQAQTPGLRGIEGIKRQVLLI